jgi:hypothetical protein
LFGEGLTGDAGDTGQEKARNDDQYDTLEMSFHHYHRVPPAFNRKIRLLTAIRIDIFGIVSYTGIYRNWV